MGLECVQTRVGAEAAVLGGVCTLPDPQCPACTGGDRQEETPVPGRDTPPLFLEKVQQGKQPSQPGVKINPSARRRSPASGAHSHVAQPHGTAGNPGTGARGRRPSRPLPGTGRRFFSCLLVPGEQRGACCRGGGRSQTLWVDEAVGGRGWQRGCSLGGGGGHGTGGGTGTRAPPLLPSRAHLVPERGGT